mgnify:CR=1 FL=1
MLGVDSNGEGTDMWKGTRSDTIIVLNIDPSTHSVNAISIPRDSKVYIAGNHGVDKINAAHAYGGVEVAKKTIEDTLGIRINRYICVHDDAVREVVDALGGIPIFVEKKMNYDDVDKEYCEKMLNQAFVVKLVDKPMFSECSNLHYVDFFSVNTKRYLIIVKS